MDRADGCHHRGTWRNTLLGSRALPPGCTELSEEHILLGEQRCSLSIVAVFPRVAAMPRVASHGPRPTLQHRPWLYSLVVNPLGRQFAMPFKALTMTS